MVPRGQQARDPGARRLWLHARLPGRAALSRQPPQPIHEGTHGIQGLDLLGRKVSDAGRRRDARTRRAHHGDDRAGARQTGVAEHATALAAALIGHRQDDGEPHGRHGKGPGTGARQCDPLSRLAGTRGRRLALACAGARGEPRAMANRPTAISTRASSRPAGSSSATSCRASRRRSPCCVRWTTRRSRFRTPDSRRSRFGSSGDAPCRGRAPPPRA